MRLLPWTAALCHRPPRVLLGNTLVSLLRHCNPLLGQGNYAQLAHHADSHSYAPCLPPLIEIQVMLSLNSHGCNVGALLIVLRTLAKPMMKNGDIELLSRFPSLQVTTTVQSMTEHVHQPSNSAEPGSSPIGSSAAQGRWLGLRIGFMHRRSSSIAAEATRMMKAEMVQDRAPDELPEKTADNPLQAAQDHRGASERAAKGGGS